MPSRFQKYGRALRRHSETMIIAERGWYFPLCRYAKSFSKVWGNFWAAPRNYDYSWEGLTFSSFPMPNRFQKYERGLRRHSETVIIAERVCIFLLVAMPNRFQKYEAAFRRHSETIIIAERDWHLPLCRYAKSFAKVWENFWAALRNYYYSWEGL